MSGRDAYLDAARRAGKARVLAIAILAAVLALVLLMLEPDRDPATRAVARTSHVTKAESHAQPAVVRVKNHAYRHPRSVVRTVHPSARLAVVTLAAPQAGGRSVPTSFLGVSTEYWTIPLFEKYGALFGRALSLFDTPGAGPLMLRIGGDSADHTFWELKGKRTPRWVVNLGPHWLNEVGALINRLDAKVILDLNLVTDSSLTAAEWAEVAYQKLPRGSLAGLEVGNEPDLYARHYWSAAIARPALAITALPKDISPATYARDFASYSKRLAQVAPRVPLVGPAVANPASDVGWVSTLLASAHPRLGEVSGHVYPYSACASPRRAIYPTITRVLSENASAGIAERLRPAMALAHRAGLPFRLTEMNSVTCGGKPGVSDSFATALWAPDALFELLRAGADGVNVHIRARAVNAAFALSRRGVVAHPLLYGLMLFDRTLGSGARLSPTRLYLPRRVARGVHLKVWAVRVNGGGMHVLLIDKGSRAVSVQLRMPATGPATVQRLLAPSVRARWGVSLGGQHVGPDGRWHGPRLTETIWPRAGGYVVTVPQMSAALVGLRLAPSNRPGVSGHRPSAASRPARLSRHPTSAARHLVRTPSHRSVRPTLVLDNRSRRSAG